MNMRCTFVARISKQMVTEMEISVIWDTDNESDESYTESDLSVLTWSKVSTWSN